MGLARLKVRPGTTLYRVLLQRLYCRLCSQIGVAGNHSEDAVKIREIVVFDFNPPWRPGNNPHLSSQDAPEFCFGSSHVWIVVSQCVLRSTGWCFLIKIFQPPFGFSDGPVLTYDLLGKPALNDVILHAEQGPRMAERNLLRLNMILDIRW